MKLIEDNGLKMRLLENLRKNYGEERDDIHVSDLIYCLREAYYRKIDPQPPTETELMFYVDGARRHMVIQGLDDGKREYEILWEDIRGHIDLVDNYPVEIKTTRANRSLPEHYFKQLGYYCAMLYSKTGLLLIQRLNNREEPWEFWRVEWSNEELDANQKELVDRANLLKMALETGNPKILPKSELLSDNGKPWKCRFCKFTKNCAELEQE